MPQHLYQHQVQQVIRNQHAARQRFQQFAFQLVERPTLDVSLTG